MAVEGGGEKEEEKRRDKIRGRRKRGRKGEGDKRVHWPRDPGILQTTNCYFTLFNTFHFT